MSLPTIEGLDDFNAKIEKLGKAISNKAILAGSIKLQGYSQKNAPVDTGFLKNSPESHETEDGAEMIFHASYAPYQEFGTENMEGKHYVQRALDENEKEILEAISNQAKKDIEEVTK